jgi:hypothetical protein
VKRKKFQAREAARDEGLSQGAIVSFPDRFLHRK